MTSDHDLLGMLRGTRKSLRRTANRLRPRYHWTPELIRQQNERWGRFYDLLDRCLERGLVNIEYRHWFSRERVMSPNWGCKS